MVQFDSYILASYWALIIMSDIDREIHELELDVINRFINNSNSAMYFEKEEEFVRIMQYSREERKLIFTDCLKYISQNGNPHFINKFFSLIGELISADGIIKNSELELFLIAKDILGFNDSKFLFSAPKEIDKDVHKALKNSFASNQKETYSPGSFSNVEMRFETDEGVLIQKISYDNSKINYTSASGQLKEHMDKIRFLARAICLEMIKSGLMRNKKSILNYRFNFKNEECNYFVIADFLTNRVFLSYLGCEDWDYHIK